MPKSYKKSYPKKSLKKRPSKSQNKKTMMGSMVNKALTYASHVPGPVGTIASGLKFVKSLINVETHYKDINSSGTITSNTGAQSVINLANGIAQGDGYNERTGSTILNKSLTLNVSVSNPVANTQGSFLRVVVLSDKKPQIGSPTWATVYGAGSTFNSQIDKEEVGDRFVILKDHTFCLANGADPLQSQKFHIDLTGTHTRYDDVGALQSDLQQNAIHVMALSDIAATNPPNYLINSRFRYYDN